MLDFNSNGQHWHYVDTNPQGGVAPSRHDLAKAQYMEKKRTRLANEQQCLQRLAKEKQDAQAVKFIGWLSNLVTKYRKTARISRRKFSH
ncbi:MAG: hypothetical protein GKR97_08820 [Rhizobiaceae bacterium]|nr:hypothetical protein [Rhizobiaceae bacterium]